MEPINTNPSTIEHVETVHDLMVNWFGVTATPSTERHRDPVLELQRLLDQCNFALGVASVASLGHFNPASLLFVAILAMERRRSGGKVHAANATGLLNKPHEHWALQDDDEPTVSCGPLSFAT
jgi:hypothetical protein